MSEEPWYWVVTAGNDGRDYSEYFLRFGLAFVGDAKQEAAMAEVQVGHRLILKSGLNSVLAVGVVTGIASDYRGTDAKAWLRDFDGWDLPGYCMVQWYRPEQPIPATGFRPGALYNTERASNIELAERVIASERALTPEPEPAQAQAVQIEAVVDHLIIEGLSIGAAEDLGRTIARIRRLADYYYHCGLPWAEIREHETRTFLVAPLLLALGWSEQCIKIEEPMKGGRADIALFDRPYAKADSKCIAIIETKGFSQGLDYAPEQVKRYGEHFPSCNILFVSNGYCYKAYVRGADGFDISRPSAYLNLLRPTDHYPLDPGVPGAVQLLTYLLRNVQAF